MAPHWFIARSFVALLLTVAILASCSSSSKVVDTQAALSDDYDPDSSLLSPNYLMIDYSTIRSSVADPIHNVENNFPSEFQYVKPATRTAKTQRGYRIQLIATQDRESAEKIMEEYTIWISSQRQRIRPKAYILFQAPTFKVHIGDFTNRSEAFEVVRWIKSKFPDAWVVTDTIQLN
jgi:hypothetical protein